MDYRELSICSAVYDWDAIAEIEATDYIPIVLNAQNIDINTAAPSTMAVSTSTASTTPAPSEPGTKGSGNWWPGTPRRTQVSR